MCGSYSNEAVMEVHAKQASSDGSVAIETPLDDLADDGLSGGAGLGVEANSKVGECEGKDEEEGDED